MNSFYWRRALLDHRFAIEGDRDPNSDVAIEPAHAPRPHPASLMFHR
jgi:hypothetical protein